jgi:hypothetical protein
VRTDAQRESRCDRAARRRRLRLLLTCNHAAVLTVCGGGAWTAKPQAPESLGSVLWLTQQAHVVAGSQQPDWLLGQVAAPDVG